MRTIISNWAIAIATFLLTIQLAIIFADMFVNTWFFDEIGSMIITGLLVLVVKIVKAVQKR